MRMPLLRVSLLLLLSGTLLALPLDKNLNQGLSDRDLTNIETGNAPAVISPTETKEQLENPRSRRGSIDDSKGLIADRESTQSLISRAEYDGSASDSSGWISPGRAPHVKDFAVESWLSQEGVQQSKAPQDSSKADHREYPRVNKRGATKARLEPRHPSIEDSQRVQLTQVLSEQNEIYESEYLGEKNKAKKDSLDRGHGSPEERRRYRELQDASLRYYELLLDLKHPTAENSPTTQQKPTAGENSAGRGNPGTGEKPAIEATTENPTTERNPTAPQSATALRGATRTIMTKKAPPKSLQHIEGINDIYKEAQMFENEYLSPSNEPERLRLERGGGTPQETERFNKLKKSHETYGELYRTSRRPMEPLGSKTPLDLKRYSVGGEYRELESLRKGRNKFANEFFGKPENQLKFERLKNSIDKTPEQLKELGTTVEELEAFKPRYDNWRKFERLYQKIRARSKRAGGPTKPKEQLDGQSTVKMVERHRGSNNGRSSQATPQHRHDRNIGEQKPGVVDRGGEEPKPGASESTSEPPRQQASKPYRSGKWGSQEEADALAIICIEGERRQEAWYVANYGTSRLALKECLKAVARQTGYVANILPEHQHDIQLVIDQMYRECIDRGGSHEECMREAARESASGKFYPNPGFFPMITQGTSKVWNTFVNKLGHVTNQAAKNGNHGASSAPSGGGAGQFPGRIPSVPARPGFAPAP